MESSLDLLWGLSVSGVYFFTSQFLQIGLDLTPTSAGSLVIALPFLWLATAPFIARMASRWETGGFPPLGR